MLGRQVGVLLRWPATARLSAPSPLLQNHRDLPLRKLLAPQRRLYATPGRPKSVVGEPSKTVKRAVKRAAAKTTSSDTLPTKNTAKKSKTKTAAKKKTTGKPLTEEQKTARAAKQQREMKKALRAAALEPPKVAHSNAYQQFFADRMKAFFSSTPPDSTPRIAKNNSRAIAQEWKQLAPADIEHYNHVARVAKEKGLAEYKAWVESHTPEQIIAANRARMKLRRDFTPTDKKHAYKWPAINDERAVKKALTPYMQFARSRLNSGDFKNIPLLEGAKLVGQEWNALSSEEKMVRHIPLDVFNGHALEANAVLITEI